MSRRRGVIGAAVFALSASVSNCGFPEYGFPAGSSGAGGARAIAGGDSGGSVAGGTNAGASGSTGSSGGGGIAGGAAAGEAGASGEAGAAGGSGDPCVFPVPITYAAHCFDDSAADGESGVDCGGSECAPCSSNQPCTQAMDCLSQQCENQLCVPLIGMTYRPIEIAALTPTPKFTLNFTYLGSAPLQLRELTIRYYYNHNQMSEPIIGFDSQATIDPGNAQMDISQNVRTSVHRFPLGPNAGNGLLTDSYLEIAFDDTTTVIKGTKFVITQDLQGGSPGQRFDQNSHYSFMRATNFVVNEAITVHRGAQTLWGAPPPLALFPECAFALGVNLNGPALSVSGEPLLSESEAGITFNGGAAYSNTANPLPTTATTTTSLLATGRTLGTADTATWPVPNGKYWAYAWLTSTVGADSGTLMFGTSAADRFFGRLTTSAPATARWGLIGPYPVDVVDRTLTLTVDGSVHVAGLKLYEVEQ
ncbi:MAG TPA: hypothetical protein VJV79_28000 [Polyangiaceae bacterium]|nr:hypothetical protein [Polyangiaceae bacterium]